MGVCQKFHLLCYDLKLKSTGRVDIAKDSNPLKDIIAKVIKDQIW
jgi:hypothetical protein